jgi:DNA repair protein RecO
VARISSLLSPAPIFDEAMVTSVVRYRDSDCIARLFTKNYGRITAFYSRGLKYSKKGQGIIQSPSFSWVSFLPSKQEGMAKLTSCDIDPQSLVFCLSAKSYFLGSYLSEIIEILLPLEEQACEIFLLSQKIVDLLKISDNLEVYLRAFELKLLKFTGYLPDLDIDLEQIAAYDPQKCIFLKEQLPNTVVFSREALNLAKMLLITPIEEINLNINTNLLMMIAKIFHIRLRQINQKPLNSIKFRRYLCS